MRNLVLFLLASVAMLSQANAQYGEVLESIQGDICSFQVTKMEVYGGAEHFSVNLWFDHEALLNFELPLSREDYQLLFVDQVYHTAQGFLSMEHPNAYKIYYDYSELPTEQNLGMLTVNLELTYDNNGHLTQAKALLKENWGFPESIWKNEYKEATCQL